MKRGDLKFIINDKVGSLKGHAHLGVGIYMLTYDEAHCIRIADKEGDTWVSPEGLDTRAIKDFIDNALTYRDKREALNEMFVCDHCAESDT